MGNIIDVIRSIFKGKKSYLVGLFGILVMIAESFGYLDLDLTVGEQIAGWMGSVGTMTVRAAIAKLEGRLGGSP